LQEQAGFLEDRTAGVLTARVDTTKSNDVISDIFVIVAPKIDNYSYGLFSIQHGVDLYPVEINTHGTEDLYHDLKAAFEGKAEIFAFTEEQLTTALRIIFQGPSTKRIIQNLYSQGLD